MVPGPTAPRVLLAQGFPVQQVPGGEGPLGLPGFGRSLAESLGAQGRGQGALLHALCSVLGVFGALMLTHAGVWVGLVHAAHEHPDRLSGRLSPGIRLGCGDRRSAIGYDP